MRKKMGAPVGNKFRVAIKDPRIRQKAYKSFCDHLGLGKSIKSWFYDDDGVSCTWETMLWYTRDYPEEFDPIKKEIAHIKGYQRWEKVVEESAEGRNKDANTATLQMLMRNKYGWDKKDSNDENKETPEQITISAYRD